MNRGGDMYSFFIGFAVSSPLVRGGLVLPSDLFVLGGLIDAGQPLAGDGTASHSTSASRSTVSSGSGPARWCAQHRQLVTACG